MTRTRKPLWLESDGFGLVNLMLLLRSQPASQGPRLPLGLALGKPALGAARLLAKQMMGQTFWSCLDWTERRWSSG